MQTFMEAETKWQEQLQEATLTLAKISGGLQATPPDSEDMDLEKDGDKSRAKESKEDPRKIAEISQEMRQKSLQLTAALNKARENAASVAKDTKRPL